jgi:hypothetical protein
MRDPGGFIIISLILAGAATYVFQMWARHQRRLMIHRERLAAIEKGIELPPLEQEIQKRSWNVQRLLLLAGLVWISLGVGVFPLLARLGGQTVTIPWGYDQTGPVWARVPIPTGLEWIGVALIGIGLSHIVTYAVGRRREREDSRLS